MKQVTAGLVLLPVLSAILLMAGCPGKSPTQTNNTTPATVTDADGNVYDTVRIGTQTWMKENLKTTKFNDGTAIPLVSDSASWVNLATSGYCWYNNDTGYKNTYGALYNWYSVNTGKLAPTGWHVPTDSDWNTLLSYLGGDTLAGGKLKETGTVHWQSPNTGATNQTGFAALPGGYHNRDGTFEDIATDGFWWSATEAGTATAWFHCMSCDNVRVFRDDAEKNIGFSVRCIKN